MKKMNNHPMRVWGLQNLFTLLVSGSGLFKILAQESPPVIATQPISRAVSLGSSVAFAITYSGTRPLNFQWLLNQAPLPFATNNILNLANVQFAQAGDYQVVVSNTAGSVTSLVAHLVVGPAFVKQTAGALASSSGATGGA